MHTYAPAIIRCRETNGLFQAFAPVETLCSHRRNCGALLCQSCFCTAGAGFVVLTLFSAYRLVSGVAEVSPDPRHFPDRDRGAGRHGPPGLADITTVCQPDSAASFL